MAAKQRTLNIPIHDAKVAPDGMSLEDVIDAEVVSDGPSIGQRIRSGVNAGAREVGETLLDAARTVRENGLRDTLLTAPVDALREEFGVTDARAQERQRGRERRAEEAATHRAQRADQAQSRASRERVQRESVSDPLAKLKYDTILAGERYMESLRKSGILGAGENKASQRKKLTGMHEIYASMMVLQCVQPLKEGVSTNSILNTLGMGASMWLLSPNFRNQIGVFTDQIGDSIRNKIADKGAKKDAKAQRAFDKLDAKGKGDQLAGRWRRRLDKIEFAERGHRVPFTTESAAMTEIALAEAAYADMRRPGADVEGIHLRYTAARSSLYDLVNEDGLEPESVSKAMRVMVGQRMKREPSIANVFGELGHGRFTRSEPREVYLEGGTQTAVVWTGDFVDSFESRTISSGSFSLRPKMNTDEHRVLASETLQAELFSATTAAEMDEVLSHFAVGAAVQQYPDVVDDVADPKMRARLAKTRTMFASMQDDGLSSHDQHFAYSTAYIDAVEAIQQMRPDLGAEWMAQYDGDWRERVAERVAEFNDMGAAAAREQAPAPKAPRGRRYTAKAPAAEPAPGSRADIVDADIVDDETVDETPAGREAKRRSSAAIEDTVHEGELLDMNERHGSSEIDGEVAGGSQLEAGTARRALTGGANSAAARAARAVSDAGHSTARKITRARVNQHYNEVDTGRVTGFGSDEAKPLQDVDFTLG